MLTLPPPVAYVVYQDGVMTGLFDTPCEGATPLYDGTAVLRAVADAVDLASTWSELNRLADELRALADKGETPPPAQQEQT